MINKVLGSGRREIVHILHLPFFERITHIKARRPMIALGVGTAIMLTASSVAVSSHYIVLVTGIPHVLIDAVAYLAHGVGSVPVIKYAEPAWIILMGAAEKE